MILLIYVVAIIFAFYMQKKLQLRREAEHERRQERFERLMDMLRTSSDQDVEMNGTSEGEENSKR